MRKKLLGVLLTVAMTASLLAGCGSNEAASDGGADSTQEAESQAESQEEAAPAAEETGEEAEASAGGKTIELWTCWTEGADTEKASKEMIQKWEEETGNTVNQTNFTYDMLHEKILTAAAGGNVPDLIWGLPEYVGEFYNMGIVADLTSYYDTWEDKSALSDAVIKTMTIDGKLIGVPYEMTVRAFLVHDDAFAEAGAEVPETWEDMLALTDFHDKTGKYPNEAACVGVRAPQELVVFLAQYGLELCTAQEGGGYKCTWKDNPEELEKATKVFQNYLDMIDAGVMDENCKNWGWEETDENFATGIVSAYQTGNWLAERETSNPDTMGDVSVHAIPYPADGQPATYMECKPLFIMEASENKDEAFSLAAAFCSKEWQSAAFADRSPRSDVSTDSKWSKDFSALADTGISFPPVTLGGINQAQIDAIGKVLQEGVAPKEAAEWLCDAINSSLEENGELGGN